MTGTFAKTVDIYKSLQQLETEESLVQHALFMEYDVRVKELRQRLKEASLIDEYARRFLGHLGGFSYACAGLPLPFGHPSIFPDDIGTTLDRTMRLVSFPSDEDRELAADAVKLLKELIMIGSNPILQKLVDCAADSRVALLIAKTRYLTDVEEYLSPRYPDAKVLTPHYLRKVVVSRPCLRSPAVRPIACHLLRMVVPA